MSKPTNNTDEVVKAFKEYVSYSRDCEKYQQLLIKYTEKIKGKKSTSSIVELIAISNALCARATSLFLMHIDVRDGLAALQEKLDKAIECMMELAEKIESE